MPYAHFNICYLIVSVVGLWCNLCLSTVRLSDRSEWRSIDGRLLYNHTGDGTLAPTITINHQGYQRNVITKMWNCCNILNVRFLDRGCLVTKSDHVLPSMPHHWYSSCCTTSLLPLILLILLRPSEQCWSFHTKTNLLQIVNRGTPSKLPVGAKLVLAWRSFSWHFLREKNAEKNVYIDCETQKLYLMRVALHGCNKMTVTWYYYSFFTARQHS